MVLVVKLVTLLCPPPDSKSNPTTREIYFTFYPEIILRGNLLRHIKRGKLQEGRALKTRT